MSQKYHELYLLWMTQVLDLEHVLDYQNMAKENFTCHGINVLEGISKTIFPPALGIFTQVDRRTHKLSPRFSKVEMKHYSLGKGFIRINILFITFLKESKITYYM